MVDLFQNIIVLLFKSQLLYLKTTAKEHRDTYKGVLIPVKSKCLKKHSRAFEALNIFLNEFHHQYGTELFSSIFQCVLLLHFGCLDYLQFHTLGTNKQKSISQDLLVRHGAFWSKMEKWGEWGENCLSIRLWGKGISSASQTRPGTQWAWHSHHNSGTELTPCVFGVIRGSQWVTTHSIWSYNMDKEI